MPRPNHSFKVISVLLESKIRDLREVLRSYHKGRVYADVTNYKGLTCRSDRESCNEIHSQLQTNGKVPTLFVFCINPSFEIVYQSHIMRILCKLGHA